MNEYPVRMRKHKHGVWIKRVIIARNFSDLVNKVCSRYPDYWINLTFANKMDLLSAQEKARALSKKGIKRAYITIDDEGECHVSAEPSHLDKAAYYKGVEIDLEDDVEDPTPTVVKPRKITDKQLADMETAGKKFSPVNKPNEVMAKKKAAKKAAGKKPAKKAVKKVAAKKSKGPKDYGKKVEVTITQIRAGIKKGIVYRNMQGVKATEKYMATRANQEHVLSMYESK